jgi:hypothetical protein
MAFSTTSFSDDAEKMFNYSPAYPGDPEGQPNYKPFFPGDVEITPAWANSLNKAQKWKELSSASQDYSQSGTDIPTFSEGSGEAYSAGSDQTPQGFGYQYKTPFSIGGSPSFNILQGQGALGGRSGEQLLRLQQGSGNMQNQQLQNELERRGIMPRGVQLPSV